jgi:3-dehydroquinate dehydratase-1
MNSDRFVLAATTNDLTREEHVRDVADVVEFRMDCAEDPIAQLSSYDGKLPVLATNRAQWFGGQASDAGRLDRLFAASEFDAVRMVDIELETARATSWVVDEFRENDVEILISYHAFEDTPDLPTLAAIFEDCARYGDVAKVATLAEDRSDALRMLQAVHDATTDGLRVAGISMGEVGRHTRAVAPLYGSQVSYAPLESDTSEYAPGQIPIHELASLIESLRGNDGGPAQMLGIDEGSTLSQGVAKSN